MQLSVEDWLLHLNLTALSGSTWMGVTAFKNPLDAWIYQEIIYETRPQTIIELGSAAGGSTLFLAHLLDLIGSDGQVISVDASREIFVAEHERIVTVTGTTGDPEVIARVGQLAEGKRTMAIHDASHLARIVLKDLQTYGEFVSPGCYFVVEDGISDWLSARKVPGDSPGPGPYTAVQKFLAEGPPFDLDRSRERFRVTNNPYGFLRRREP